MKRIVPAFFLTAYSAILLRIMVFKDLPTIKIGQLMFNFGGTDGGHPANFVPFKTIISYLFGEQGLVIGGVNLLGNIALLIPIGLLAPLVFTKCTWKKSLALAVATGLAIELLQAVLRVGIFDIDDVMLNALGVMTGFGTFVILARWIHLRKYKYTVVAAAFVIIAVAVPLYALYPKDRVVHPTEGVSPTSRDLGGGNNPAIIQ